MYSFWLKRISTSSFLICLSACWLPTHCSAASLRLLLQVQTLLDKPRLSPNGSRGWERAPTGAV